MTKKMAPMWDGEEASGKGEIPQRDVNFEISPRLSSLLSVYLCPIFFSYKILKVDQNVAN